jgi:hypothetical protein
MLMLMMEYEMIHRPCKGGVDAKELFHLYVVLWIQDKRLHLLDFCKFDRVRYQLFIFHLMLNRRFQTLWGIPMAWLWLILGSHVWTQERCTWVTTQHSTSPFVEEVYERIKETLNEYEIIMHRWPEYTIPLEHVSPHCLSFLTMY